MYIIHTEGLHFSAFRYICFTSFFVGLIALTGVSILGVHRRRFQDDITCTRVNGCVHTYYARSCTCATEVVTCHIIRCYDVLLNGNCSGGPGSCFLKVRRFHSTQKQTVHENQALDFGNRWLEEGENRGLADFHIYHQRCF